MRKRVLEALERVKPIAQAHDATLGQVAIAWTFSEPGVTAAIVGARDAKQATENAGAMRLTLSDDERRAVRAAFDEVAGSLAE